MVGTTQELIDLYNDTLPNRDIRVNDGYFFIPKKDDMEDFLIAISASGLGWTSEYFDSFELTYSAFCYFLIQKSLDLKEKKLKIKDPDDPLYGTELTDSDLIRWSAGFFWGDFGDGYRPYLGGMTQQKKVYIIDYNSDLEFSVIEIDNNDPVVAIRVFC